MDGFPNALHICCVLFSTVDVAVGVGWGLGGSSKSLISILVRTTYSFPLVSCIPEVRMQLLEWRIKVHFMCDSMHRCGEMATHTTFSPNIM